MGSIISKKSSEKRNGTSSNKRNKKPSVVNGSPSVEPALPPAQESSSHIVTDREVQEAINRGNVVCLAQLCIIIMRHCSVTDSDAVAFPGLLLFFIMPNDRTYISYAVI